MQISTKMQSFKKLSNILIASQNNNFGDQKKFLFCTTRGHKIGLERLPLNLCKTEDAAASAEEER